MTAVGVTSWEVSVVDDGDDDDSAVLVVIVVLSLSTAAVFSEAKETESLVIVVTLPRIFLGP